MTIAPKNNEDYQEIRNAVHQLSFNDGTYQRLAVEIVLSNSEIAIPFLIEALQKYVDDPESFMNVLDFWGMDYILMLLGYFSVAEAHATICNFANLDSDLIGGLDEFLITEYFEFILFRTANGNFENVKQLITNKNADEYMRGAGIDALKIAAINGVIEIDHVKQYLVSLFEQDLADKESLFWFITVSAICDLYPEGYMSYIESAYENGLIDPDFMGISEIVETIAAGEHATLEASRKSVLSRGFSDDFHYDIEFIFAEEEDDDLLLTSLAPFYQPSIPPKGQYKKSKSFKKNKRKQAKASKKKNRRK